MSLGNEKGIDIGYTTSSLFMTGKAHFHRTMLTMKTENRTNCERNSESIVSLGFP
jgi:hypothetical protein